MRNAVALAVIVAALAVSGQVTSAHASSHRSSHHAAKVKYADVQKFFNATCTRCHGDEGPRAGISLTSYDKVMKGGEEGPIVVAGDPLKSLLIKAVKGEGARRMPPRGPAVDAKSVKMLESWVKAGAKNK